MHPILFQLGPVRVYSYGVLVAVGGALSVMFWLDRRERMGIRAEGDVWGLVNWILAGGVVGGRLLYLAEYARGSGEEFWRAALAWDRGFSVLGAVAGVLAAVYAFCRRRGLDYARVLDYVCTAAPLWHFFGRLGCFAAGCCFGRPPARALPWAVTFTDPRSLIAPELLGVPVHPAQLYEAAGNLALAAILAGVILPRVEAGARRRGSAAAVYLGGYGVLRFFLEPYRGDTVVFAGGLTAGQALSLGLMALGAAGLAKLRRRAG